MSLAECCVEDKIQAVELPSSGAVEAEHVPAGAATGLYCPVNLWPNDILAPKDRKYGDRIIYLCHAIMMRRVQDQRYRKGYRGGFVGLKAQYLQNIIGRHNLDDVKRLATSKGVVECDDSYCPGKHAKGYRVCSPYAEAKWELREVADKGLRHRLQTWRVRRRRDEWERIGSGKTPVAPEVCKFLYHMLQRCQICKDAPVEQFAPEIGVAVDKIWRGDWFFQVDGYGRIHTNITNLKRELRPYLSVDGQALVNVDIANSQPLFIGMLLCSGNVGEEDKGRGRGGRGQEQNLYVRQTDISEVAIPNGDVGHYLELCEQGKLYQYVHQFLPGTLDYNTLKHRVLASLYDRDSHRNAVYRVLNTHFPTLMQFARRVKHDNFRRLAHLAQQAESQFMYGQVVPRVMRERPGLFVTTIHDSILVPHGAERYIREVMLSEFRRRGVSPTVRTETQLPLFFLQNKELTMVVASSSDLLTRPEAAEYIGVKSQTLAAWASKGRYDLPFIKVGWRVKYRRSALDDWLSGRTITHTGQPIAGNAA